MRWAPATVPAGAEAWLTGEERARLAGLHRAEERFRFVAGHAFIRSVVGWCYGVAPAAVRLHQRCPSCGGPHGKPAVTLPDGIALPPRVSLAHAGRLDVVALSDEPVGIDVEPQAAVRERFGDLGLSGGERSDLERLPVEERSVALTRWWVRKRAVIKASTIANPVPMSSIEVTGPDHPPAVVTTSLDLGGPIQLYDLELDADGPHDGALAVRGTAFITADLAPFTA